MIQLILSVVLMYLVVGSAGYWGLRKRRDQQLSDNPTSGLKSNQKQGVI